jgi:hypothetical protein
VLISISLMGMVITVVLGGILAVIRVSSTNNNAAKVEALLTSAADRLSGWTYLSCPALNNEGYDAIVAAAAADVGWEDGRVRIVSIEYWDPELNPPANPGDDINPADGGWSTSNGLLTGSTCEEDVNLTTARTLQKVTIEASSPDDKIVRTLTVVKSNVGDKIDTP